MNPRTKKPNFFQWLTQNGAELRSACRNEVARFMACDTLCIVYAVNRKGRQSFVPDLARTARNAWLSNQAMDLSNTPSETEDHFDRWQVTGVALCAAAARAKAGELLDVNVEATALRISPERFLRSMRAHGVANIQEGNAP